MFVGTVHWEPLPVAAEPQIREQTGQVLVEVQERLAPDIKYPWPPLDESGPRSQAREQIAQHGECVWAGVLHRTRFYNSRGQAEMRWEAEAKKPVPA